MPESATVDVRESGKLTGLMVKFSVPCTISLLVGALYNIVDQIFIANAAYLGSYGNAANTVVYPLTVICLAIAVTFGDGGGSFLSIALGARQKDNAHRSVGSCVTMVILIGILLTVIYAVFQNQLLTIFGGRVNDETFYQAKQYFTYITMGVPFYMIGQSMAGIISADGNPRYSMCGTLTGCIINCILDPIFIYVCRWGMMGAALATIIGQIVVAILFLAYLPRMKSVKLHKDSFRIRGSLLKRIIPLGMNSFFAQASIVLSMAAVLNMVKVYGALDPIFGQEQYAQIPTAVIGIVMKFFQIVISIAIGISAGSLPIVGYNVGAKRNDRVLGILKRLLVAEAAVGVLATLVFEIFPKQLIGLFGAANESVYYNDFAIACIRIFLCLIILSCLNKGVMIFMQAMGKAGYAISISVLREIVFGVGLPLLLPIFFGLDGILYFMPVADVLTAILAAVLLWKIYKQLTRPQVEPEVSESQNAALELPIPSQVRSADGYVITIGRSYGAGGRSVGKTLAKQLNIPYYDSELLEQVAVNSGLSQKLLEQLDERPASGVLYRSVGFLTPDYRTIEVEALQAQAEVIEQVASQGPCVIIGRRADQILQDRDKILSVFVGGSPDARAHRVAQRENMTFDAAKQKVLRVDKERSAYYSQHSDRRWGAADSYDLSLDTSKFGLEGTVSMILDAIARLEAEEQEASAQTVSVEAAPEET